VFKKEDVKMTDLGGRCSAAGASQVRRSRFGFLGNTYSGMLDMYSDFAMIQAQTGLHVEVLEMCDLNRQLRDVTPQQIKAIQEQVEAMFQISSNSEKRLIKILLIEFKGVK
jgi:L-arabinose isomerase